MSTQTFPAAANAIAAKRRTKTSAQAMGNVAIAAKKSATSRAVVKPPVVTAKTEAAADSATNTGLLEGLVRLRDHGTAYYENFFVPGRNAMMAIMSDLYAQFHAAKSAATYQENLKLLRMKLKDYGVTVRSSSTDASLFIRMVFKDFDDKQVSIYSRSLAVAFDRGVTPDAFSKFVEDTDGGFYGIVISAKTGEPIQEGAGGNVGKAVLYNIKKEQSVHTVADFQWNGDEDQCVLLAVRGMDDDSAALKKIAVSEELLYNFLAKYAAEKKALLKKALSSDVGTTKSALKKFENERGNYETDIGNLEADLRAAENAGDAAKVKLIRVDLKVAQMNRDSISRNIKLLQGEIEADSK